ncbi:MAG: GAF domain-containing protein [Armatimonadetes bacterium]|nr:GAF domain-containing protein [Armatimonadota bacterium]
MDSESVPFVPALDEALGEAMELLRARAGSLMLLDEVSGELRIAVARGLPPEVIQRARVRAGDGIAGWVFLHSRPRLLHREERAPDSLSGGNRLDSAISAPLRVRRRTIGVLNISDPEGEDFGGAHVRMLLVFARQAAAAIENARLYHSLQRRMSELRAIYRTGQALTSSLNLGRVLRETLRRATHVLGARSGSIMLIDPEEHELRIAHAVGLSREIIQRTRVRVGESIAGAVAQSGVPIILAEGEVDERSLVARDREVPDAAMCVPLRVRGRAVGVLNISQRTAGGSFSGDELRFLASLADQSAVAIENARLYHRLQGEVSFANRELIHANHLLEHEKAKIQAVVDGMADGVIAINRAGRITFLNPTAEAMLGIPARDAVGGGLRRWPTGKALLAVIEEARGSDGMSVVKEIALPAASDERRVFSANVSPLRDERGRLGGCIAVLTDVTDLKEISDLKTELVSFVSHELRNPVTSILGFAEMLRSPDANIQPAMREEFCGIMVGECRRLLSLVNEVLDVSRMEAGRGLDLVLGPVDVPELLERAVGAQRTFTSRHELVLQVPEPLPIIMADGEKIHQVMTNILSNAIKYSPGGGTVVTSASARGGRVRVSVADQGLGIPPEMIGKLFQRYYRVETKAHTTIRGTGLGLFFVKGVVEAHGGSVWVESQHGKGSRFSFELPAAPGG